MTQDKESKSENPQPEIGFALSSTFYERNGFQALPLDGKLPSVTGATGSDGVITHERMNDWRYQFPNSNIGLRAHGWIAVDVDHHDDKFGADQLAELERMHGQLPATWKSSARGKNSPSAQYFFRVDDICPYVSDPTRDIEIIHPFYRYSAVSPSIHPGLGTQYVWYSPDGEEADSIPTLEDFAELPLGWILAFSQNSLDENPRVGPFKGEVSSWVAALDDRDPTPFTIAAIEAVNNLGHIGHNGLLLLIRQVHDYQENLWERGTRSLFDAIQSKYLETTNEKNPELEMANIITWVVGDGWAPQPVSEMTAQEFAITLVANHSAKSDSSFWKSRESLKNIYALSRKKVISPYTLLGMTIVRVLNTVPYDIHYASFRGSAPLNTLVAFVGPTGTGKSLTLDATNNNIAFADSPKSMGGNGSFTGVIEPGSGEALPDSYMHLVREEGEPPSHEFKHPNHAGIFSFDEIGMLEGRQSREGSTIVEYMKQGWSGTVLGRELANGKGTMLPAKSYRFSLFVNVQPARAGLLFSGPAISGGLPSRFLFFSTQDERGRIEFDATPAELVKLPKVDWRGVTQIDALAVMQEAHMTEAFKSIDGGLEELDSHLLLSKAKVTVALAVLEGRSYLTEEDWELAEFVIQHSVSTRDVVLRELLGAQNADIARQGKAAGLKNSISAEIETSRNIQHVAQRIRALRSEGVPETGERGLKKRLRNDQRKFFAEALELIKREESTSRK